MITHTLVSKKVVRCGDYENPPNRYFMSRSTTLNRDSSTLKNVRTLKSRYTNSPMLVLLYHVCFDVYTALQQKSTLCTPSILAEFCRIFRTTFFETVVCIRSPSAEL